MFLNDRETATDLLYFEAIAKTVVKLIRDAGHAPVTIGVHGDWGAGKSSVLKMTEAAFADDKRTLCLWFNGWTFEGFDDAKTVVMETIVDELRRARPTSAKVAEAAGKVLKRIDWLKLARKAGGYGLTALTGIPTPDQIENLLGAAKEFITKPQDHITIDDVKAVAERAGDFVKEAAAEDKRLPHHIHEFRKEFKELLDAADIDRLVVIVDDLDRCLPATAIATLEAIRLFLFVERTAFVVGADEVMIEYAVREHFPDLPPSSGPISYPRNYLEKLIQVPFRIPALGMAETRIYTTLLLVEATLGPADPRFKTLLAKAREQMQRPWMSRGLDRSALPSPVPAEFEQALVISAHVTKILSEGTRGNPRQIKRFLNSLMLREAIANERGFGSEIQRPVLAKVMLAERFYPEFYEQFARLAVTADDGAPEAIAEFEQSVRAAATSAETENEAKSANGKRRKRAASVSAPPVDTTEWAKNEWIASWATIDPPLAEVDLRPYVFVTRDKRAALDGITAASHLDGLVERLMGAKLVARSATADVKRLTGPEAEQTFDAIRGRVLQEDSFGSEPKGVQGIVLLVETHAGLQRKLLTFIKELPVAKLGAWAATSWGTCFAESTLRKEFESILQAWSKQTDNKMLQASAKLAAQIGKKD